MAGRYYGVVLSFWAGLATGIGGILAVMLMDQFRDQDQGVSKVLAFSLALAAGVMITVSVVDLYLPLVRTDGLVIPTLAVVMGVVLFRFLSQALSQLPSIQTWIGDSGHGHSHNGGDTRLLPVSNKHIEDKLLLNAQQRNLKLAVMMFLVLTLHNFPEGLAVSVSASASADLGFTVAIAVAFHNGPEGMAIACPYYAATNSKIQAVLLAFLSGLSEPLGALVAVWLLGPLLEMHRFFVPYILCVVAGIMIASSIIELIPESWSYKRTDLVVLGYVVGTITMLLTIYVT